MLGYSLYYFARKPVELPVTEDVESAE